MMMIKKTLLAASLLMMAGASQAELVHTDFIEGDGMATVDNDTGITWLKFQMTKTYSLATAEAATAEGGALEGWRLATADEVKGLWANVVGETSETSTASPIVYIPTEKFGVELAELENFQEYLGGGYWGSTGYLYGSGYFWQDKDNSVMGKAGFIAQGSAWGRIYDPQFDYSYTSDVYSGIYMVKDEEFGNLNGNAADVPISGVAMASLGLLGLAGMRRRKAK